jgi:hypothetical protein
MIGRRPANTHNNPAKKIKKEDKSIDKLVLVAQQSADNNNKVISMM